MGGKVSQISSPYESQSRRGGIMPALSVMLLAGGQGTRNLGGQLTLSQPGGRRFVPTTLRLAHPDLKIQRHLCM